MMDTYEQNYINLFRHSSPYIQKYREKIFVIMLPGSCIAHKNFSRIVQDISVLSALGVKIVLTYDAKEQIKQRCLNLGIEIESSQEIPITNQKILQISQEEMGKLRFTLEALFSSGGINSYQKGTEINVVSGNFITARPYGVVNGQDYLNTGTIRRINVTAMKNQLDQNALVLLPSMASSPSGELFILGCTHITSETAVALKAAKLIIYHDDTHFVDQKKNLSYGMITSEAQVALSMQKKSNRAVLSLSIDTVKDGVERAHIIDYRQNGALITEIFTRDGVGFMVADTAFDRIRTAQVEDIRGIVSLIQPLEEKGILLRRSRQDLERNIDDFVVALRDDTIIGCAALNTWDKHSAILFCVAIHPDYQKSSRGMQLLKYLEKKALNKKVEKLFVLTTQALHWFLEHGFSSTTVESLPKEKQKIYNMQRGSKILCKELSSYSSQRI